MLYNQAHRNDKNICRVWQRGYLEYTMSKPEIADAAESLNTAVADILGSISQEREREIISRRFGLEDRKETLEQIGEMLGITRERVRQF